MPPSRPSHPNRERANADSARTTLSAIFIVAVGFLVGFRFRAGLGPAIGAIVLAIAFGVIPNWL